MKLTKTIGALALGAALMATSAFAAPAKTTGTASKTAKVAAKTDHKKKHKKHAKKHAKKAMNKKSEQPKQS